MSSHTKDKPPQDGRRKLVQTQLTAAFFQPREGSSNTISDPSGQAQITHQFCYFKIPETKLPEPATPHSTQGTVSTATQQTVASTSTDWTTRRGRTLTASPSPLTTARSYRSSSSLALIATETRSILSGLISLLPNLALTTSYRYTNLHGLHQNRNPHLPRVTVSVVNGDSLDIALTLPSPTMSDTKPPLVLNMANAYTPGGGWLKGALAQEESICYRSSLSLTLKRKFYPIPSDGALYAPTVVVFRSAISEGHELSALLETNPEKLGVVSIVSVAAIRDPDVIEDEETGEVGYRWQEDAEEMKWRIRCVLRTAGREKHRRLVLGALGCGAFGNPNTEVVKLWKEVLQEREWRGWWESITFAVLDEDDSKDGMGNYGVYWRGLDGFVV